ncbi:hypothetical protein AU210_008935 [Fusarium oxysporum f. sp. radicis-cucumerinum]|uniref:Uncharacterized protein n=2 Tax=Fusarium oxysporum TaxID=5507 RepID=A0A2H3H729_FUSOX|nr:hypothetical protein AU210_008935 [Fusarium oxysporum f. sp. radicis-cucumerinum]RKK15779.1 hypothetical protein BFJ65_g9356 [Fusarium oxysporum f. sp. cepae]RKK54445.1 hypothetical protein BFJ66_g4648 [Fusarium oxysporum f. sp. cepae]RKK56507.1 hypothetical protein BFJ67_g3792 [Fusarium oxysporum f. sp. cepae]
MELSRPEEAQIVDASRPRAGQNVSAASVRELERTVAGFQAILTDEDRKKLQQLKTTSHDSQSIITFTAELDLLDKNRRGKSVASRLASFLQTIEQFTPIVDTYIQSNPDIAALIWGSIKLTFLFLANFASYFQSFVELLHGFGSLCTRFAEYQVVFNESSRLKSSVCQFHTAVVTCCQQIVLAVRRPLKNQLLKAITQSFQSELRSYVEDIRAKAEEVQGDIQLVKAQCDREEQRHQNTERQEATNHRKRMLAWTSKSTTEMEALHVQRRRNASEQKRRRLLEELSSFNFTSAFNSTRNKRHIGTAKWVFDTPEFQQWVGIDGPHVLHVTGKIGSGKTVLSSSVVEKLSQIRPPQQFVSFFFIRFDDPLSLDAETIIRSCVQQLLSAIVTDDLDQRLASELEKHLSEAKLALFSLDQLSRLYSSASEAIKNWFIVLDGLDECNTGQQSRVLKFFQAVVSRAGASSHISILLSSRETCTSAIKRYFPRSQRLVTGLQNTSADIVAYVDDIIIEKLSTGELVVSDPSLIDEILKTIASKEQGMFLWAFLAIEDICSGKSDKEIRQALKDIPSDLPTTFDRALSRIVQKRNQQIAKKAFMWTKAVSQPLTLSQFREALSIEIGQHTLRQEDLISGIERLPVWCENLLYAEETDNTVRFSHHSIQEFLLVPDSGENGGLHIDSDQCDKLAGEVCITYVNLDNFQTALVERKREPLSSSAIKIDPSGIAEQTIQSAIQGGVGTRVGRLARQFVKTSNPKKISTQRDFSLSSSMSVTSKAQGNADYPFLEYASTKWFKHTKYIDENETEIWRLFGQLVQKPLEHSQGEPWHSTEWKNEAMARFPNHDDARSECYCRVIRTINSGEIHGSDDRPGDGPNFSHLCLAFMYAELNGYYALACRSFQLLIVSPWMVPKLEKLVCILGANKNYEACQNGCASLIATRLNHHILVAELRKSIAHGISSFPALPNYKSHPLCDCADQAPHELMLDICQVLKTGYRRTFQPQLQAFAIVTEALEDGRHGDMPGILDLSLTCREEAYTLFEAKSIHRMLLIDVLIQGLLSTETLYKGIVSNSIASFVEYETTPTFRFHSQILEPPGSMPEHRLIAYTICFLVLLDGERPPAPAPDISVLREYRRRKKLMNLHGETIAVIFRRLVIPALWPTYMASYIVQTLFGELLKYDSQHIAHAHEDSFRQAVWNNNWDIAAALLELQPTSLDRLTGLGYFSYIREAVRCQNCWRCTQNVVRQLTSSEMHRYSFRLCANHVSDFNKIAGLLGGIYDAGKGQLLCPGHSTDALPEREGRLKRPGF